ncbi:hypothetical protein AB0C34_24280 [Nocardia sp. NPDC049220]|uniref:hypothetical protein n=1 Tax=Nocardia sp. NPDC049220 TaxID=3155273 RepID=UPI0033FBE070
MTTHHLQNVADLLLVQHSRMRELVDDMLLGASSTDQQESLKELARLLAVHEATQADFLHSAVHAG